MPLRSYGVLKATILDRRLATDRTDHYQLLCGVGTTRWRVAINAHSDVPPSDVDVRRVPHHARGSRNLKDGWRVLRPGEGLDYIRGGLLPARAVQAAAALASPGANNDLNELFDLAPHARREGVRVRRAVGRDRDRRLPERGVHDVHQNQGNIRRYQRDDGVWQDGGLLVQTRHAPGRRSCCASSRSRGGRTTPPATPADRTARDAEAAAPRRTRRAAARAEPGHDLHAEARRRRRTASPPGTCGRTAGSW